MAKKRIRLTETIVWIDVEHILPDAGSEVLVCYERNDCDERDVTMAVYDDEADDDGPWTVDGGLMCFGHVLFWAEVPEGPTSLEKKASATSSDTTEAK